MRLIEKIEDKSAKIGIIGLGYVGLPLAIEFVNAGYEVIGIDVNESKINSINSGKNYIKDVDDDILKNAVNQLSYFAYAFVRHRLTSVLRPSQARRQRGGRLRPRPGI